MKRGGILWHRGVGGIRDFGSLIKIHVFFAKNTFWNIFKQSTVPSYRPLPTELSRLRHEMSIRITITTKGLHASHC